MTPKHLLLILFAYRYVAVVVFMLVAAIGAVITVTTPKTYSASTDLLVDSRQDPTGGVLIGGQNFMATQVAIIQSERVAIGVVKRLRIDQTPNLVESWRSATRGKTPLENYYANLLRGGLRAEPLRTSNVIVLTFEGADPKFVTAVVNAYAQAYLDLTIDLRVEPVRQYANWFDDRLKTLRESVATAQNKLTDFQRQQGIVGNADQEIARLDALLAELNTVQSENAILNSRQKMATSDLSQDALTNQVVQRLRSDINNLEAKLTETRINLGLNHPQRIQQENQLVELNKQMQLELDRVSGGAKIAKTTAGLREAELRGVITQQKQRVLELRQQRDRIAVLSQDVDAAKRIYDSVLQRSYQLNLEKQTDQANVSILSPAIEPSAPFKPNKPKFIGMSLLAAVGAALAAAIGLELLNRKVRVIQDLMIDDVPVLGIIERKGPTYTLRERLALAGKFISQRKLRKAITSATLNPTPRLT